MRTSLRPRRRPAAAKKRSHTLDFLLDVTLQITVEVGRARADDSGSAAARPRVGDGFGEAGWRAAHIYVNGKQVARGEAVIVNEVRRVSPISSRLTSAWKVWLSAVRNKASPLLAAVV